MDFVHDLLTDGRRFRVLNIADDYSRVCESQRVDLSIGGQRVIRLLEQLAETRGLPKRLVPDIAPEVTSRALFI